MKRKGYKIVMERGGELRSFIMDTLVYRRKKWISPAEGCGPLGVFDDLEDAKAFLFHEYPSVEKSEYTIPRLFECEYRPSDEEGFWEASVDPLGNIIPGEKCPWDVPVGTKYAASVRLGREVCYDI